MARWLCSVCNIYVYDEEKGDPVTGMAPGTRVADFPSTWRCPVCGAPKEKLVEIPDDEYVRKLSAYAGFTAVEKSPRGIAMGADNPDTTPELTQEYGRPLGFRGRGQGITYRNNLRSLAAYTLKTRLISSHREPDLGITFLGEKLSMPIIGAPMSGLSLVSGITEETFATAILDGCRFSGTIGCTGNSPGNWPVHPAILALRNSQGKGIAVFKPRSQEIIKRLFSQAEAAGAVAVGVDIDGAGSVNFAMAGDPVFRKSVDELRELRMATRLPFMVKGVMSSNDALGALEAGASVIAVSNHGGRVLDAGPGVADVLPGIVEAVRSASGGGDVLITADGGVRTGFDALKMLALGADAGLVGRPLAREAVPDGAAGVKRILSHFRSDLRTGMVMTSCDSVDEISREILFQLPAEKGKPSPPTGQLQPS